MVRLAVMTPLSSRRYGEDLRLSGVSSPVLEATSLEWNPLDSMDDERAFVEWASSSLEPRILEMIADMLALVITPSSSFLLLLLDSSCFFLDLSRSRSLCLEFNARVVHVHVQQGQLHVYLILMATFGPPVAAPSCKNSSLE